MRILLGILLITLATKGLAKTENELVQEYLSETLDNIKYDKRIPPIGEAGPGSSVNVSVSMWILDIGKVDENKQTFDAHFYFRQSWVDPRLKFSGDKFKSVILRDVDKIWTPDLFFVNEMKGEMNKMVQPNIFCRIEPDGKVLFSIRVTERLSCVMDLRKFPLDVQKCEIRAESYGFTRKYIELEWMKGPNITSIGVASNITELEFDVIEVKTEVHRETLSSGTYTALVVKLNLQRKIGYYIRKLYVPFTILVLLSWLPLWIKASRKEKYLRLTLLLVILYLMVTIASELEQAMPKTPYTKASDVWTAFCEVMVFAAFLEFIASCIIATEAEERRSKNKGEIMSSLDPEGKESNVNGVETKSRLSKFILMFEARNGGRVSNDLSQRIDRISRILFASVFIIFNIIYWTVCCS